MEDKELIKVLVETLKSNTDLSLSVRELAVEIKHMREDCNNLAKKHNEDVKAFDNRLAKVEEKPLRRYEQIVGTIITRYSNSYTGFFVGKIRSVKE